MWLTYNTSDAHKTKRICQIVTNSTFQASDKKEKIKQKILWLTTIVADTPNIKFVRIF